MGGMYLPMWIYTISLGHKIRQTQSFICILAFEKIVDINEDEVRKARTMYSEFAKEGVGHCHLCFLLCLGRASLAGRGV
jgi:hypothetical protein